MSGNLPIAKTNSALRLPLAQQPHHPASHPRTHLQALRDPHPTTAQTDAPRKETLAQQTVRRTHSLVQIYPAAPKHRISSRVWKKAEPSPCIFPMSGSRMIRPAYIFPIIGKVTQRSVQTLEKHEKQRGNKEKMIKKSTHK